MKSKIVWALFGREIYFLSAQKIQYYVQINTTMHFYVFKKCTFFMEVKNTHSILKQHTHINSNLFKTIFLHCGHPILKSPKQDP